MQHIVQVEPGGLCLTAESGTTLFTILRAHGLAPEAPCGGHGACGKCSVLVDGKKKLSCRTVIDRDMTVTLPERFRTRILTALPVPEKAPLSGSSAPSAAFDIGTTTVVCSLLTGEENSRPVTVGALNPQQPWGADVVSRIRAALDGQQDALTKAIRTCMRDLLGQACAKAGIPPAAVRTICAVGNPCMQQLFLGMSVENLASIPFLPKIMQPVRSEAEPFLDLCPEAILLTVPDISGYVGADTVACIAATEILRSEKNILMVDIGTNGELVLKANGRLVSCSTAAGPALEGAKIRCGMRASDGAIDRVSARDGALHCHVIGEAEPRGICGSGIVDATAAALSLGLINRRGRILSDPEPGGERRISLTGSCFLTQGDIREIQLAKGAIAAGIHVLCEHIGIRLEEIDEVLLAGAFGSFIDPENACRIGLFPPALRGKIRAVGNAAGAGAVLFALHPEAFEETASIVQAAEPVELASEEPFRKRFAECMYF